jgi:hypothetical protein
MNVTNEEMAVDIIQTVGPNVATFGRILST